MAILKLLRKKSGRRTDGGRLIELTQLHGHGLGLRVMFERGLAVFAPLAGHFEATEWSRRVDDVVAIHPYGASLDRLRIQVCLVDVLGEYGRSQTVISLVGSLHDFIEALERKHADHRAKNFVLGD